LIYCHYAPKVGISENDLRISASPKLTFDANAPGISASGFARDLTGASIAARRRWSTTEQPGRSNGEPRSLVKPINRLRSVD